MWRLNANCGVGDMSKIIIALDCPLFDKEGHSEEHRKKVFQDEFHNLVNVVHNDVFPKSYLIFPSVLFRRGNRVTRGLIKRTFTRNVYSSDRLMGLF